MDFDLNIHAEEINGKILSNCGYTIRFLSPRAVERAFDMYGIIAEPGVLYRFTSETLFISLKEDFSGGEFSGTIGDDSWSLYALQKKDYWESIYGKGYIEKRYPLRGREVWESAKDLVSYGPIMPAQKRLG